MEEGLRVEGDAGDADKRRTEGNQHREESGQGSSSAFEGRIEDTCAEDACHGDDESWVAHENSSYHEVVDLDADAPRQTPAIPVDSLELEEVGYSRQDDRGLVLWNFETHS